jgi:hypothetical protein
MSSRIVVQIQRPRNMVATNSVPSVNQTRQVTPEAGEYELSLIDQRGVHVNTLIIARCQRRGKGKGAAHCWLPLDGASSLASLFHSPYEDTPALGCGIRMKMALLGVFAGILTLSNSYAAIVTWQPAHNISQSSDVVVSGTLVGAFNVGASGVPSTTVNTVVFSPLEIPSDLSTGTVVSGNFSFSGVARQSSNTNRGSSSPPFSTLAASDPPYATLLQSAADTLAGGPMGSPWPQSLDIFGLNIDHLYLIQFWTNDSDFASTNTVRIEEFTPITLRRNTSNAVGGLGQFAIGTFVADYPHRLVPIGAGPINAFQLRDLGVVPEPSIWGILGVGSAVLLGIRKPVPRLLNRAATAAGCAVSQKPVLQSVLHGARF